MIVERRRRTHFRCQKHDAVILRVPGRILGGLGFDGRSVSRFLIGPDISEVDSDIRLGFGALFALHYFLSLGAPGVVRAVVPFFRQYPTDRREDILHGGLFLPGPRSHTFVDGFVFLVVGHNAIIR